MEWEAGTCLSLSVHRQIRKLADKNNVDRIIREVWVWAWRVGLETLSAELLRIEGVAQGFAVSQWLSPETKISFSHLPHPLCCETKGLNCYEAPCI